MKKITLLLALCFSGFSFLLAQNVGIGTSSPVNPLHIHHGTSAFNRFTNNTTGSTNNDGSYIGTSGNHLYFVNEESAGNQYFYTDNSLRMIIDSTGKVGIGTTAPLSKFHIVNGQDVGLGASSNGYLMLGQAASTNVIADNNEILARNNGAAADLFLQHDAGNLIICGNEQGAVGIGVASGASIPAGYLLAVDGKIISEELKVQLSGSWPDYVFQDNYNLKSFDHLRSFIKDNKHLPNIPPAAEVEKNGIEVGDMQKRMMEKIEELTLYILELEQRLKSLENSSSRK